MSDLEGDITIRKGRPLDLLSQVIAAGDVAGASKACLGAWRVGPEEDKAVGDGEAHLCKGLNMNACFNWM